MLSVVIPAYYEEETVPAAAQRIGAVLTQAQIPHELIFVDDGSKDATWARIQAAAVADASVCGVRFSRNFGKEAAIFAGLQHAKGECVAVIDCDLQHPPEKLVEPVGAGLRDRAGQHAAVQALQQQPHRYAGARRPF